MRNDTYYIEFLNGRKDLIINPGDNNNETCLDLFGKHSEGWGEKFNKNLLHILENFKRDTQPAYGDYILAGQLWFDTSADPLRLGQQVRHLKVYTNNQWETICNAEDEPLKDIMFKADLVLLDDYIKLSNNTTQMTGQLLVKPLTNESDGLLYATKKYVDSKICKCAYDEVAEYSDLVSSKGDTITNNAVIVPDDSTDSSYAATKKFVDTYKFFDIIYDNDISFSNGAVYSLNDMNCYTVISGKDNFRLMTGKFKMVAGVNEVTISWTNPYINDFYILVSGEMHEYNPYDTNSGKPDDIFGSIGKPQNGNEYYSIKVGRTTTDIDEIVYFMMQGDVVNNATHIAPGTINDKPTWDVNNSKEIVITLPKGFTFKSDAVAKITSTEPGVTGTTVIVPPNVMVVKLDVGSSTNPSIPVTIDLESSMYTPSDTLQNMSLKHIITNP
jgi:hypothetical protein